MIVKNNIDRSIEYNQRDVHRDTSIRLTIAERAKKQHRREREREEEFGWEVN